MQEELTGRRRSGRGRWSTLTSTRGPSGVGALPGGTRRVDKTEGIVVTDWRASREGTGRTLNGGRRSRVVTRGPGTTPREGHRGRVQEGTTGERQGPGLPGFTVGGGRFGPWVAEPGLGAPTGVGRCLPPWYVYRRSRFGKLRTEASPNPPPTPGREPWWSHLVRTSREGGVRGWVEDAESERVGDGAHLHRRWST